MRSLVLPEPARVVQLSKSGRPLVYCRQYVFIANQKGALLKIYQDLPFLLFRYRIEDLQIMIDQLLEEPSNNSATYCQHLHRH